MRALFIIYILSALLLSVYASNTNEIGGPNAQKGELERKVRKTVTRKTVGHLVKQPEVSIKNSDELPKKDDVPPIYEWSREAIEKLDYQTKMKLTAVFTAEQWNAFIGIAAGQKTKELYRTSIAYLGLLNDKKLVRLMEEAYENGLEHLFKALVPREQIPRSPKVVELLEKCLTTFPEMRRHALLSLYTLGFSMGRWHFTSSEEDLGILLRVIKERFFTRKQVIDHLPEMVEADSVPQTASGNLLKLLMRERLVHPDDFCNRIPYQKAYSTGNIIYLEKAKEFCPALLPDQECVDQAVEGGHGSVLEFMENEIDLNIPLPSQKAIDAAAENGKLQMLQKGCPTWMRFPSIKGANGAAEKGHLDVLKWMAEQSPPILPTKDAANSALMNGQRNVVIWMAERNPPILPTKDVVNFAAMIGRLHFLEWMATRNPPILPNSVGANAAAANGQLDVLKWMASLAPPILPTKDAANWAASDGRVDILDWMASLVPPILPDQYYANRAAGNGNITILQWMASLSPPILPTQYGANLAVENGELRTLKWMAERKPPIIPTSNTADVAAENGKLDVLEWMASLNPPISPTKDGAKLAKANGHFHILKWMVSLVPPIYPN